jgi:Arc/MetJ-type ribon-helix-helix transcriptional regulator
MKKPFPVSIEEDLAKWIIQEVSKGRYRNRSHLVEEALNEFRKKEVKRK